MSGRNTSRPVPVIKNHLRPLSNYLGYINDFVVCPYNELHVMKHHKLMRHLVKCEKKADKETNKGEGEDEPEVGCGTLPLGYEKCPYDGLHRYQIGKKEEHFSQCKARALDIILRSNFGSDRVDAADIDNRYAYNKGQRYDNADADDADIASRVAKNENY